MLENLMRQGEAKVLVLNFVEPTLGDTVFPKETLFLF